MKVTYPETEFGDNSHKIVDVEFFNSLEYKIKYDGMPVCLVSGTFDLYHPNHSIFLKEIKRLYPKHLLVVMVDDDEYTKRRKGDSRPVLPQEVRLGAVAFDSSVDLVILHCGDNGKVLRGVNADVFIMSESTSQESPHERTEDFKICQEIDCDITVLPGVSRFDIDGEGLSTSAIIQKILYTHERLQPKKEYENI